LHFVNVLTLTHVLHVVSNQSDCLFKTQHVSESFNWTSINRPRYYSLLPLPHCIAV